MARRRAQFYESDVQRAIKGAEKAGFAVGEVRVSPSGEITLTAKQNTQPSNGGRLDAMLEEAKRAKR